MSEHPDTWINHGTRDNKKCNLSLSVAILQQLLSSKFLHNIRIG